MTVYGGAKTIKGIGKSINTISKSIEITPGGISQIDTGLGWSETSITLPTITKTGSLANSGALGDIAAGAMLISGSGNQKGVSGKGWKGDKTWRNDVNTVKEGGTIENLDGRVPTQKEAIDLIKEAGGKIERIESAHPAGGVSNHTYKHINYYTKSGAKGTIQIK